MHEILPSCHILLGKRECLTQCLRPETQVPLYVLVTDIVDGLYQMLSMKMWRFNSEHSSMLCREETGKKRLFKLDASSLLNH